MESRTEVTTSTKSSIKHLSTHTGTPLEDFQSLLAHQANFLRWIISRHQTIVSLKQTINAANLPGAGSTLFTKEATYTKYRWYVEQLVLLEAINAFETFYKRTFVRLGELIREFVEADEMRNLRVDPSTIWLIDGQVSAPALLFEPQLYHDLKTIDDITAALVGKRRYNPKQPPAAIKDRVRSLMVIFQIRHTLSHNHGLVTSGDRAKFKRLGIDAVVDRVIDPAKDSLRIAAIEEIKEEAEQFTNWLAGVTADFLTSCIQNRGYQVPLSKKQPLEDLLGGHANWANVNWTP
jgi:hypothetical protein